MELADLLGYEDIVIQCHDNPDADALASGYAIMWFFAHNGKDARFIYRGRNKIKKSNLQIMLDELEIPVEYAPDFDEEPDLLITVDCQYGQKNVTETNRPSPEDRQSSRIIPCQEYGRKLLDSMLGSAHQGRS